MAATIEGAFVLVDRASSTMAKMERQAMKTMAAIEGVGAAQDSQAKRSQNAERVVQGNTSAMKEMEGEATSTRKSLDSLGKSSEQSSQRVGRLQRAISMLRGELTKLRGGGGGSAGAGGGGGGVGGVRGIERDLKLAKGAVGDFMGAFGALGSALMAFKFPALGAGITMLVQSVVALGGAALGAMPGLAALAGGINGLPAVVGAGLQALLSLKLAFQGVMQAAQAGMQAQNQWAYNQREYQQQLVGANDAVISAHQGLTNAIYSQQQAQLQLTVARRDSIRTLQDMEFAANTAVLKEARAGLNIQQAKMELQQAMLSPGTSQLQLQSLRLGVMEAVSGAQQTRMDAHRARQDYSRARRGDPSSQPAMQLAQARHGVSQATIEVANAERALTRSQTALNILVSQGNSGVAAYKRQLMGLQPIQRRFVQFLVGKMGPGDGKSLMGQFQALQQSAGQGLFPPLERGVRTLMGAFPLLNAEMRKSGSVIGNLGARLIGTFFGPKSLSETRKIMDSNVRVMRSGSGAIGHVADMLRKLMVAAGPTLEWLAKMVDKWTKMHDAAMSTARGQDALRTKFAKFRWEVTELLKILHNVWTIFHNVNKAAWDFHQTMMRGAVAGTGNLAALTGSRKGQKGMHDWFMGLLPLLRALGKLVVALGKGLVGLTSPTANKGTAGLVGGLTKLVPTLERVMLDLERIMGPGVIAGITALGGAMSTLTAAGGPFALWLGMLTDVVKAITWLLKRMPVLTYVLAGVFAANTIAKFTFRMTGAIGKVLMLARAWRKVGDEQHRSTRGMPSPGTGGGGGFFSRLFGRGGGAGGEGVTHSWGILSMGGPGSEGNPLVVRVQGGGLGSGASGNPFAGGSNTLTKAGAADAGAADVAKLSRMEKVGAWLSGVPLIGGLAKKIPGALGRGGLAGEAAAAAGAAGGELGTLGKFAAGAGKFLGIAGVALTVLPGILSFFKTKGSFGSKLGAAGNAIVNSATFGLVNLAAPSRAHQYAQGASRGNASFGGYHVDPVTGVLTAASQAAYQRRIATLQGQYNVAAHGTTVRGLRGTTMLVGQDAAVRQDRYSQLMTLKSDYARLQSQAGQAAGAGWSDAYSQAIARGEKPARAMGLLTSGLTMQMAKLGPTGQKTLMASMAQWSQTFAQQNPKLKGQMDDLNQYIINSFRGMGQNVEIVNGQILTGSQQEWGQVYTALTDPMLRAQEKLDGTFAKIRAQAVGELEAMGLTKTDATMLLKNPASANSWTKFYNHGAAGTGSGIGRRAAGGRVPGEDRRDVVAYGGNMLGGGELVMNRWHEMDANARLMRHGEPTVGAIVSGRNTPHWAFASGGRMTGGYVNPIPGFTMGRTDMGVDANAAPGTPILAIGDSTLTGVVPNWYHQQPLLDFRLNSGMDAGKYWYVAEQIQPVTERIGSHFRAGQVVARYAPTGTGIEIGWAANASGQTLAQGTTGYSEGQVTGAGKQFQSFLTGLAHGRVVGGGPGGGNISLRAPQIGGLAGLPKVLAQRGANAYARNLQAALNYGIGQQGGGNFAGVSGLGGNAGQNEALGRRMMLAAGWGPKQWPALQALWTQESGWNANAVNSSSGAYGIPQCVPLDTRVLTRDGWKCHDEVQVGDETIGYNPVTGESEWTRITAVFHPGKHRLRRFGTSLWSARCTPNHRWVMAKEGRLRGQDRGVALVELRDRTTRHRVVLAARADTGPGLPISLREAALLGWIMGDGWRTGGKPRQPMTFCIGQTKQEHWAAIDEAVGERGRITRTRRGHREWRLSAPYTRDLVARAGADPKTDPEKIVREMSAEQREVWLDAVIRAEGHIAPDGFVQISQSEGAMANAIILAAYLCGYRPSVYRHDRTDDPRYRTVSLTIGLCSPQTGRSDHEGYVDEDAGDEDVWCVSTELGSWTAEQDGNVFVTGNSLGHGHPYNLGDARGQIAWGLNYIRGRYGSPDAAEAHEKAFNWYSGGGRMNWAGWNAAGGTFKTNGPTIFGAGEGGRKETVTITPEGSSSSRPIVINIERIEVHRPGDVQRIVDEELGKLAESLRGR